MTATLDLFAEEIRNDHSGAEFSVCGRYRYRLWRQWQPQRPQVVWVMLNPSVADATTDDNTIRKCCTFARSWGYGGIVVVNLFAFRARHPGALLTIADPVGPENDRHLLEVAGGAALIVAGWGAHGSFLLRDRLVRRMLAERGLQLHALRITKDGQPGHPLYLPGNLRPEPLPDQKS